MIRTRWRSAALRARRQLVSALGTRRPLKTKSKVILSTIIFLASFAVRSLHAVDLSSVMYTSSQPFSGLTDSYDHRAVSITEGNGLLGPYGIDPSDTQWLTQAPGYSVFLACVYSIAGRNFYSVQLVQNGINSLSPVLIFLIASSLIGIRVGFVAGLLSALSHHLGHISNFILPDEMNALPVLAGFYFLTFVNRRCDAKAYGYSALAGLSFGIASWLRAQTMLLGIFVLLILLVMSVRRSTALKHGLLIAVLSLVVIAPITIRNWIVYGELIPIQLGTGLNLWEGIADASGDRFGAVREDTQVAAQEAELYGEPRYGGSWTTPDGIKRDRDRTRRSLDVIVHHPIWYAGVMIDRCAEMLKYSAHAPLVLTAKQVSNHGRTSAIKRGWESIDSNDSSLVVGQSITLLRPIIRSLQRIEKETMLGLVIVGVAIFSFVAARRAAFLLIVPVYYFLFQSAMHTEFRYTLPMQFFLFVFAAVAWVLLGAGVVGLMRRVVGRIQKHSE